VWSVGRGLATRLALCGYGPAGRSATSAGGRAAAWPGGSP